MVEGSSPPPVDMSHVDPGLQPILIALLFGFPAAALIVLIVRFWRKASEKRLGGGRCSSVRYANLSRC
jgi:hypothetical protein